MTRKKIAASIIVMTVILLVYVFTARPIFLFGHDVTHSASLSSTKNSASDKHWVCPMHPEISQDHPGTCPICGMKLVESGAHEGHEHGVHVDNATVQRLGVRLARVKQAIIGQEISTYGNVDVAENKTYAVHPKYEGWIKKLHVHAIGESVKAGQVLYEIYSPELVTRERTYLSSIERRKQLLQTLQTSPDTENDYVMELTMDAAKDRARLHQEEGVSVENITRIEESKQASDVVQIVAERTGVVSQINAKEGSFVAQANPILLLSDIASVWVDVTLYPDQVAQVRNGDTLTVKDAAGHEIRSRLSLINPIASNNKVTARAEIDNSQHDLRPGTYVDVSIQIHPHRALVLPRTAVMYTGQGNTVMLSRGEGHFLPVHVETGVESGDEIEILDGLQEGAEVAVNGQFLLDSAAAMGATAERMHTN
ncbi:MAG: efflux RND transporter periplasmic adaptor subunit [Gallionella sp.]|jgi:Cu(I)/Ag(I) efflux system membrane fusion protein|nr:efflux RND transporter periplasmic adaptor subunit [Gallionella sp.]